MRIVAYCAEEGSMVAKGLQIRANVRDDMPIAVLEGLVNLCV